MLFYAASRIGHTPVRHTPVLPYSEAVSHATTTRHTALKTYFSYASPSDILLTKDGNDDTQHVRQSLTMHPAVAGNFARQSRGRSVTVTFVFEKDLELPVQQIMSYHFEG